MAVGGGIYTAFSDLSHLKCNSSWFHEDCVCQASAMHANEDPKEMKQGQAY